MNTLDKQYTDLLQDILDNGVTKHDRTGTGTLSVFGRQIRHKMSEGFPLITTKKMYFKGIVTELLWFLRGDTNIKFLVDNDCHIWDGDALKAYHKHEMDEFKKLKEKYPNRRYKFSRTTKEEFINKIKTDDEFAKKWGELGPIYGAQWRHWGGYNKIPSGYNHGSITHFTEIPKNDQLSNSINLLKTDPDSRRNRVSAWNVGELDQMTLPPCHTDFQFFTRELNNNERIELYTEKITEPRFPESLTNDDMVEVGLPTRAISLMWNQRSVDTFLGLPFNIASYGLLLEIIAKAVNMVPDELIGNLGDTHLYLNHIEQAKEQIGQPIFEETPTLYPNGPMNEGIKKQIVVGRTREPFPLPKLIICNDMTRTDSFTVPFDELEYHLIKLIDYQSHPTIKAPISN